MEQEKILNDFTKWCDDNVDWKSLVKGWLGVALEASDRLIFSAAIRGSFEMLPDEHKEKVLIGLEAITSGKYNKLIDFSVDEIVTILKTPLGDAKEKIIIGGLIDIVFKLVEESRK